MYDHPTIGFGPPPIVRIRNMHRAHSAVGAYFEPWGTSIRRPARLRTSKLTSLLPCSLVFLLHVADICSLWVFTVCRIDTAAMSGSVFTKPAGFGLELQDFRRQIRGGCRAIDICKGLEDD